MAIDNLKIWNAVAQPPEDALKKITGGRLNGMTDIKPQWRYQVMTEQFGMCGVGWKFTIDKLEAYDASDGQVIAFANISLYVMGKENWSDAIPGTGGSMLVAKEKESLHSSDEAYKMAITDALSVAMKMLGVGANVYLGHSESEYSPDHTSKPSQAATSPVKPQSGTDMPNKEHWCYIHDTEFFMKGKMKGFAHPIGDTGQWCNEKNVKKEQEDIPTAFDNLESEVPMAGQVYKAGIEAVIESIEELSNPAQRKKIFATSNAMGYTDDDVKDLMTKMFKTEHTHDLTKKQANELIEAIARGDGLK